MFRRLILEDSVTIVTIVAFVTALTIYLAFAWRAVRMKRPQVARFENLPFATPTPAAAARGSAADGAAGDQSASSFSATT
jgi:hypothetical protein